MTKKKLYGGALLKDLREKLGLNQRELEDAIKTISKSEICSMEMGKRSIGELAARRLENFFIHYGFDVKWKDFYFSTRAKKQCPHCGGKL